MDRYDGVCSLPTVDAIDQFPEISISGRVEPVLPVDAVVKGNQRMGKGLLLNEIGNVPGLCLGLAQEAAAYRNASKKIADNDSGSIRRPDLLEVDPDRGIRGVGCQMVVDRPGSQKAFPDPKSRFALAPTGKGELRLFFEGRDTSGWKDAGYVFNNDGNKPIFSQNALFVSAKAAKMCKKFLAVGIGGGKEFYTPALVRGVHRAALHGETFSLHLPGTPDSLKGDAALAAAVEAVTRDAARLGVKVVGR